MIRAIRFGLIGLLLVMGAGLAPDARASSASQRADAIDLLRQAQIAAKTKNYQGTFAHQRNGQMRSFRITHRYADGQEFERLEVLDNNPKEYLRHNDRVQCLIPHRQLIISERQHQERFPALFMTALDTIADHYALSVNPKLGRVAGRQCHRISIAPRDEHRPRYDLCLDQKTGLLLEAQMRDDDGAVLEHIAFTQLQVGKRIDDSALEPSWSTQGWQVLEYIHRPVDLKASGWFYREPPGYHRVAELERQFGDGRHVNQLILTDGLATISVFIEPYQYELSHHQMSGASRSGAVNLYGKQHESYWVMVAGEAPATTVKQLAESIVRSGALHQR